MATWYNEVVRRMRLGVGRKRCVSAGAIAGPAIGGMNPPAGAIASLNAWVCVIVSLAGSACVTTTYREQTTLEETTKEIDREGPVIELVATVDGAPLPVLMDLVTHLPLDARLELKATARHPLGVYRSVLVGSITLYCAAPALGGARTAHAFDLTSESAGPEHDPEAPQPEERVLEWGVELKEYGSQCAKRGLELSELQGILEVQAVSAHGHLGRSPSLGFLTR
jgi:hypothetical protein